MKQFSMEDIRQALEVKESSVDSVFLHPAQIDYLRAHHPEVLTLKSDGIYFDGYKVIALRNLHE